MWKVESAEEADGEWVKKLFTKNKATLGNVASSVWWRWLNRGPGKESEKFLVIRPWAFAHFLVKKNGEVSMYEIAVDPEMKRQGLGKALMEAAGYPMQLKTDAENLESNAFYKQLGFYCMGSKRAASGKLVNIYQRFE